MDFPIFANFCQFLPIFVTNVENTWFLGDFYGKIVENRGNLKHESSKKHANFSLFGKKQPLLGIIKKNKRSFSGKNMDFSGIFR